MDLCSIPLGPNPDGLPPNFENPMSLQSAVIAISAIMLTFAIVIVMGRLYVNRNSFQLADYFIMVGLILDVGIAGSLLALSKHYRHEWDTPLCWLDATYMKLTFVEVLVVGPALFFPKAAIFLFYLQIFSVKRLVRIGSKIGLVVAFLAYFPASLTLCYFDAPHVGQTWDELLTSGMPQKGIPGGVTVGVASVIVDIYVFILPLPTLFSLNMALSKKMQLMALFTTAFMGIVASVVCLVYRIKLLSQNDSGWRSGGVSIAIIVENNVAIIVGSLPAFSNFLRIHISQSTFYKSLQSKLSSRSGGHISDTEQGGSWPKRTAWTYGSPQSRKPQYQELSDSVILMSHVTVPDGAVTAAHESG
ncbi:hypothetical protein F4806DRAFT_484457 [Annulohypoxylon nitens]|nr:hypothetical protein F4806DRAFT_484457 [Annulohypoxylon nitens]